MLQYQRSGWRMADVAADGTSLLIIEQLGTADVRRTPYARPAQRHQIHGQSWMRIPSGMTGEAMPEKSGLRQLGTQTFDGAIDFALQLAGQLRHLVHVTGAGGGFKAGGCETR